ncbi:MAG: hypothetical protein ACOCW2_03365 [Chitinivibrionales bacterium]
MLSCNHYNPFSDANNANTEIVSASFEAGDTIPIFSTQRLSMRVLVKELVTDIQVISAGNRLWASSDTALVSTQFSAETFTLDFSWADTGMQTITIITKTQQDEKLQELSLHTCSPLQQDSIRGHRGETIWLRTPPVADRDAGYYWALGSASQFFSQHCSTQVSLTPTLLEGVGRLWVSDGDHLSPVDSFYFAVGDTIPPTIKYMGADSIQSDTILTGDPLFTFRASITDQGGLPVDSASVNGLPFDHQDGSVHSIVLENMEQYDTEPLSLEVFALDRYTYGNESRDTFYIQYVDTLPQANPVSLTVMAPGRDSVTVGTAMYEVFGICENNTPSQVPVTLIAYVNDSIPVQPLIIREKHAFWEWSLPLSPGYNAVRIVATEHESGTLLDRQSFHIRYIPDVIDSVGPQIATITAQGKQAHNLYTTRSSVRIGVKVFDEHGWMDSVYINQTVVVPDTAQTSWYYHTVDLAHTTGGNEIVVRAVDAKGNPSTASAVIFRNRRPLVESRPAPAFILADSLFTDTIQAFDPDGDSIQIQKQDGPADLLVTPQGTVYWVPQVSDTGSHTVTVRIWDGYQPVYESFTLFVSRSAEEQPGPIQFATSADDFPVYLEVGVDTLHMPLRIRDATGVAPWTFTSRLQRNNTLLQNGTSDSIIHWVPTITDTGSQQLVVTVTDIFPSSDTLYPRILVVGGNNPCSLSIDFAGKIMDNGTLDLNAGQKPDTLVFRIHDKDPQVIERYTLSMYQASSRLYSTIDSALVDTFALVVDPEAFNGYDTVIVTVSDRKNNTDTLRQVLYYGVPPEFEGDLAPPDQSSSTAGEVTFSWGASDPDGDFIWYELFAGTSPDSLNRMTSTPETNATVILQPGRDYHWYVRAHDWKSTTTSMIQPFRCE